MSINIIVKIAKNRFICGQKVKIDTYIRYETGRKYTGSASETSILLPVFWAFAVVPYDRDGLKTGTGVKTTAVLKVVNESI